MFGDYYWIEWKNKLINGIFVVSKYCMKKGSEFYVLRYFILIIVFFSLIGSTNFPKNIYFINRDGYDSRIAKNYSFCKDGSVAFLHFLKSQYSLVIRAYFFGTPTPYPRVSSFWNAIFVSQPKFPPRKRHPKGPRVPTGAYGCSRVPTGLEKSVFFLVFTIRKYPFKGQKCTKILVVGPFRLLTWSRPTGADQNPP